MKLKFFLLSAICALSLSAFAQTGTLIFYETFNGMATADSNPYDIDCKIGGTFYVGSAPAAAPWGDWFNPDPTDGSVKITPFPRWDYPNNSMGNVWQGYKDDYFRFKFTTKDLPYVYFSTASLYWGSYEASYSFDGIVFEPFNMDYLIRSTVPAPYMHGDGDRNWFFDEFVENLGGQDEVYIQIYCIGGNPIQLDDLQATSYTSEVLFKQNLEKTLEAATKFYEDNGENSGDYCPEKMVGLPAAIEAAKAVFDKADATQAEVNEQTTALNEAYWLAREVRDDFFDDSIDPEKNESAYDAMMERLDAFDEASKAYYAAIEAMEAIETAIATLDELGYSQYIPEESLQEFNDLLDNVKAITDLCYTEYVNDITAQMDAIIPDMEELTQNLIASESAVTEAFIVFPNPADAEIRIAGATGAVYIFNAAGQQVLSITNYQGGVIPVSSLAAGTYNVVNGKQSASFIKK